jgi:hypothetical protein
LPESIHLIQCDQIGRIFAHRMAVYLL